MVLLLLLAGAVVALLCGNKDRAACIIGAGSAVAALVLKLSFLFTANLYQAVFQLPVILVGIAAALHSIGYLKNHAEHRLSVYWGCFDLMLAAMLAVTMLGKGFAFLVAWEVMGLSSFALVAFDWKKSQVRQAAWVYLLSCELGGLLLVWLLAMSYFSGMQISAGVMATVTMIAFGLKAGFPLLHVWLPEAHPAAPAPVSAIMSAALIPLGFYGIWQWAPVALVMPAVPWVLLVLGITGMLGGILFGAAQKDLKRLLAYSSVENIGIITMAAALALLGHNTGNQLMEIFGWCGVALHIINHALLKGTLFLGAGSVYKSTHTLNMDVMGGLSRKMPLTAISFTLNGMGISGLPPFCGFAGELMIYLAAFQGIAIGGGWIFAGSAAAAVALALTGGAAAAAFAKTISAVFAGEPRSAAAIEAANEDKGMFLAQLVTAIPALLMPLAAPFMVMMVMVRLNCAPEMVKAAAWPLACNGLFALLLMWLCVGFMLWRNSLRRKHPDAVRGTWDCGFAEPTARMQYTATAFIQPLADLFNGILRQQKKVAKVQKLFPESASMTTETPDAGTRWVWTPLFSISGKLSNRVRHLQSGMLHIYIAFMVLAILIMLLWCFVFSPVPVKAESKGGATAGEVEQK